MIKENIIAFKIFGNDLYYNHDGTIYKNNQFLISNVEGSSFWLKNDIFYFHDNEGLHNLINFQNNKRYRGNIAFALETIQNTQLICYYDYTFVNKNWEYKIGLFDISELKFIRDTNFLNLKFFSIHGNRYYALGNKQFIFCFDINLNLVWQNDISNSLFSSFGKNISTDSLQIVGIYDDILWLQIGEFQFIGIDVNTGEVKQYIDDIISISGLERIDKGHVNLKDKIHLDDKLGVLKFFAHRYYIEIDLNESQGYIKKDFGPNWNPDWRIRRSNYYPEFPHLLFFCGYYQSLEFPNAFGVFDSQKGKIIWFDTTKDNMGYFYNPPQMSEKLLVVSDDKHNMLVYEKFFY